MERDEESGQRNECEGHRLPNSNAPLRCVDGNNKKSPFTWENIKRKQITSNSLHGNSNP